MIYIYNNELNNIVTRFSDRRKRTDTFFLWFVKNEVSGRVVKFLMDDLSPRPCSYNMFQLDVTCCNDPVPIKDPLDTDFVYVSICLAAGHNTYKVYETDNYTLDCDDTLGLIEEDIMFVELERTVNTSCSLVKEVYY
jgi:hypothetical protein